MPTEQQVALAQELKDRELSYTFLLSMFFEEVNEEFIVNLQNMPKDEANTFTDFIVSIEGEEMSDVITSLRSEFAALFLAMSATPVFTSESVYTSANHCMMQEARDAALSEYRAQSFGVDKSFRQPEDHIAVELAFMAQLCIKAQELLSQEDQEGLKNNFACQLRFASNHLAVWIPEFCENIRKHPRANFYLPVADMLESFVAEDVAYLSELNK